jgi:MFS family permease
LYGIPYFISAFASPILGIIIDKKGKRALFIMSSSILVTGACLITAFLPDYTEPSYMCLLPQIMLGIGYSIYAAALWGSIPYTCIPRTVGTAYGLTTAVQNIGLLLAPLLTGWIQDNTTGYTVTMLVLAGFAAIGFFCNIILYLDDINNRGGVLDKVDKATSLSNLILSPTIEQRDVKASMASGIEGNDVEWRQVYGVGAGEDDIDQYKYNDANRLSLKMALAKGSAVK